MDRKKIVILGASSGIGKAIAIRFAKEGSRLLLASDNAGECEQVMQRLEGSGHTSCGVDIRNDPELQRLQEAVVAHFGRFDVLINSIGISQNEDAIAADFSKWDKALQVMMYGVVKSCRLLVPLLNDNGRIIHITSIHASRVAKGSSAYGMSKAAVTQFTRSLAVELADRNILANTIAPGFIDTPMSIKEDGVSEMDTHWFQDNYIRYDHLPLKRAGQPEEIAGVAWFLAGPDASYITGSVVIVDGGLTITF